MYFILLSCFFYTDETIHVEMSILFESTMPPAMCTYPRTVPVAAPLLPIPASPRDARVLNGLKMCITPTSAPNYDSATELQYKRCVKHCDCTEALKNSKRKARTGHVYSACFTNETPTQCTPSDPKYPSRIKHTMASVR
jgi:hypothetical protein